MLTRLHAELRGLLCPSRRVALEGCGLLDSVQVCVTKWRHLGRGSWEMIGSSFPDGDGKMCKPRALSGEEVNRGEGA